MQIDIIPSDLIFYPEKPSKESEAENLDHSFEHALFGYMTAVRFKGETFDVYYALPELERVTHRTVSAYMFFGNVTAIHNDGSVNGLPDGNMLYRITYNGLH